MLDVRLVNANVVTMDRTVDRVVDRPVDRTVDRTGTAAREIGVWHGRVVGVGSADSAVSALPARQVVDLDGATVLPGFVDAHVHLAWAGRAARTPSVAPSARLADVLAAVREAALARPPGDWVDLVGYDQRPLGRHVTAAELDAASAGRKILMIHNSGHACVVNTAVLEALPAGTDHEHGVLAEDGMAAARALRLPYPVDEVADAVADAGRSCLAQGVTACAEAGIAGGLVEHSPVELAAYQRAYEQGRLPLRVQLMVAADVLHPAGAHPDDGMPRALDLGLRTGFGGDWLSVGALKIFLDGGMMPRTAALSRPYEGLDHSGRLYADADLLEAQVMAGHRAGWQLAIHAIGDRAVDLALDAVERAQRAHPRPRARHRIEHAGLVRPDQLARFARAGVTAVVQPGFLWHFGDDYAAIMGEERAPWLYRGQAFLDHGVPLVASSDRPVTPGAPLRAIQFMVERAASSGQLVGPAEAVPVDTALAAHTVDAARACHWEDTLGSIAPGKHADLVVLAEDPRRVDAGKIADIEVLATVVAGRVAYGRLDGWEPAA